MITPCQECRSAIQAWEDTKPSQVGHRAGGLKIASGANYDDSPSGTRDNRAIRWRVWRDLVVSQTELILRICGKQHKAGQVALFDVEQAF